MHHNVSCRRLLIAVLLIAGSNTLVSQVSIKERVEIKPKPAVSKTNSTLANDGALFAPGPQTINRYQTGAIAMVRPAIVTTTGKIEMGPRPGGDYPNGDLTLYFGRDVFVSYKKYPGYDPQVSSVPVTHNIRCRSIGPELWSAVHSVGVENVLWEISGNSATITFIGKLGGLYPYTARTSFSGVPDESYNLASVNLTADASSITQCRNSTTLHITMRNNAGQVYEGASCQNSGATLTVESGSDVQLAYYSRGGKQITVPFGDFDVQMYWNYQGETANTTATITLNVEGQTRTKTVDLVVAPSELKVTLGKSVIGYGETTTVSAEIKNPDGSTTPIPPEWKMFFMVDVNYAFGFLYSPDSSRVDTYVEGKYSTVNFYARPQASPPDSIEVMIEVWFSGQGGGAAQAAKMADQADSVRGLQQRARDGLLSRLNSLGLGAGKSNQSVVVAGTTLEMCGWPYETARLVVKKEGQVDHFAVTFEKGEIGFAEASKIYVQAKNAIDEDVEYGPDNELAFFVVANTQYGTLVGPQDDTIWSQPGALNGIRYGDAHIGKVRFAAVLANPLEKQKVKVRVFEQTAPDARGEKEIAVVRQTLKIVMVGPKEVWPLLPPFTPQHSHQDNNTVLEIQMNKDDKPVSGHTFSLASDYVKSSGGHDHTDSIRAQSFENYGSFVSTQTSFQDNPIIEKTQINGRASFGYVASIFGDRMTIKVQSEAYPLLWDTVSIAERVPDLELLPDRFYYDKIGGTDNHHGPRDDNRYPFSRTPDNNHWGMRGMNIWLDSISYYYKALFPSDALISINDLSLPLGGRFDINGHWNGKKRHEFHRFGLDADVRSKTIPTENREDFEDVSYDNGAIDLLLEDPGKDNEHYHLFFWNH